MIVRGCPLGTCELVVVVVVVVVVEGGVTAAAGAGISLSAGIERVVTTCVTALEKNFSSRFRDSQNISGCFGRYSRLSKLSR